LNSTIFFIKNTKVLSLKIIISIIINLTINPFMIFKKGYKKWRYLSENTHNIICEYFNAI